MICYFCNEPLNIKTINKTCKKNKDQTPDNCKSEFYFQLLDIQLKNHQINKQELKGIFMDMLFYKQKCLNYRKNQRNYLVQ